MNRNFRWQLGVLLLGILLLGVKFAGWWITGSNVMLSDALESIINVFAGSFSLYSIYLSAKPRDADHPYGHGKIEFVSASLEGTLIAIAGLGIILKSAYNLAEPQPIGNLDLGIYLGMFTGLFNGVMGWLTQKQGEIRRSPSLIAEGKHLQTDAWSTLGLIIGIAVVWISGLQWLDSVFAIGFGLYILFEGFLLLKRSLQSLLDATDFELIRKLAAYLDSHRKTSWIDVHNLRTIQYGSLIHVDCHLTVPYYYELQKVHDEVQELEQLASGHFEEVELFIHADPCLPPSSCTVCLLDTCPVRGHAFVKRVPWTLENITLNTKHTIQAPPQEGN